MDPLKQIETQIAKEKLCVDDLVKEVALHTKVGRYQLAADRGRDMQNSIIRIQQLERQKELYLYAVDLVSKNNREVINL